MPATAEQTAWVGRVLGVAPVSAPGEGVLTRLRRAVAPTSAEKLAASEAGWTTAVAAADWAKAAVAAKDFSAAELKPRLAALPAAAIPALHAAAIADSRVGKGSALALATAALERPIMGSAQSGRLATTVANLSTKDQARFKVVLDAAQSADERAYIGKGLAAGHSMSSVEAFAAKIAGKDAAWMRDNLALTGDSDGKGVRQQWSMSCNSTVQQAVRGQMDPIYALKMHEENPHLSEVDRASGTALNPSLGRAQKKMLETAYADGNLGGEAVPVGSGIAARGRWNTDLLNDISKTTGISYERKVVDRDVTMGECVTAINDGLAKGLPVPLIVGNGGTKPSAHYVVIVATDPGPPRYYSIHDPAYGATFTRTEDQMRKGNLNLGWTTLFGIENPTEIPKQRRKAKVTAP